ncbi:MAG: hypothetical protein NT087_06380 [Deltaproteobacteria bacterium]|nr:hypothetical protein [Deltaproteobacteria bacterium]
MKRFLIAAAIAAASVAPPALAGDVGVSVSIGQPGFYGHIDIGDFPQPRLIYPRAIIVERGVSMDRPPIYLHVPPGHAKHWDKHCREYNACGERVFFVHDDWYEREYVPRYQERHHDRQDDRQDYRRDERRDEGRDDDRGNDKGKGHNKGHGQDR